MTDVSEVNIDPVLASDQCLYWVWEHLYTSAWDGFRDIITETALQLLLDNVYSTADAGKPTLRVSLDLSAASDTIDHAVLLKRLHSSFGITDTVYSWLVLQSYQLWQPDITFRQFKRSLKTYKLG